MDYYTAKELAGKPGMTTTERGVRDKAQRESWPSRKREGKGGGKEYPFSALPQETQAALLDQQIESLPEKVCQLPQVGEEQTGELQNIVRQVDTEALAEMKTWQQQTMDARLAIVNLISQAVASGIGVTKAVTQIVQRSKNNTLPDIIERIVPIANARAGKGKRATLSYRTLMNWWSLYKNSDGDYTVLAPKTIEQPTVPVWAPAFLKQYQVPQKISILAAIENMKKLAKPEDEIPSEGQVRRFLQKYSRLDIQKGRKSGSELRSQKLYRTRDASYFYPMEIVVPDGHSFKARVQHPTHGRPFKPEVCACIDVVTHAVVGWSTGLAESSMVVADALRHVLTVNEDKPMGGLPLFLYSDNGAGFCGKVNSDDIAGLYPRLGINFETGRPGNPQGRGIIERLNSSLWIPAAKKLPTYCGKDMDSLVGRKVYLQLAKDVREIKKNGTDIQSDLLISWPAFLIFLEDEVDAYNNRPHSSLPRITDRQTGRKRNMTPCEMWANFVANGWQPDLLTEHEIEHLFRPHEMAKTYRGTVRLHKKVYADAALEHYHGMQVMVGYDVHDPGRVWVRDTEGRLIVIAKLDANKSDWFDKSKADMARIERHKNRSRTIANRQEEIDLELGSTPIELKPARETIELSPEAIATSDRIIARLEKKEKKKVVANSFERYLDLRDRVDTISEYERAWLKDYEIFTETGKKSKLLRNDEFCTGERQLKDQQNSN